MEKRNRNIAHCWQDKRILRFFRKYFSKKHNKNLRTVYIAATEMESDFTERKGQIRSPLKTLSTYCGLSKELTSTYLSALRKADILDIQQEKTKGSKFAGWTVVLYKWEESNIDNYYSILCKSLKEKPDKELLSGNYEKPVTGKTGNPENTVTGKIDPFKNTIYKYIVNIYKKKFNIKKLITFFKLEKSKLSQMERTLFNLPKIKNYLKQNPSHRIEIECFVLALILAYIINSNRNINVTLDKIKNWAREIKKIQTLDKIDKDRIKQVLSWYASNIGGEYVPVVYSGQALRKKFLNLEAAMERGKHKPTRKKLSNTLGYSGQYKDICDQEIEL